jgi:hypothetical protein
MTAKPFVVLVFASLSFSVVACAPPPSRGQKGLIDFIQDGVTTRQEVQVRLGDPGASYDAERILTYRLGRDQGGDYVFRNKSDWFGVCSNLVLVLDHHGILRKHSLVSVGGCA